MTLIDDEGNRAPNELYARTSVGVPQPPPIPLAEVVAVVGLVFSSIGFAVMLFRALARPARQDRAHSSR